MSHRWFYQLLNDEFGPVPQDQITQLIEDGTLAENDLVRREDQQNWVLIGQLETVSGEPSLNEEPAELADLSELSFSFEESDTHAKTATQANSEELSCLPSIDDIQFDETPQKPGSQAAVADHVAEEADAWFCESAGNVLGPLPLRAVVRMAASGMLSKTDRVRCGESGKWTSATAAPEIAAVLSNTTAATATTAGVPSGRRHTDARQQPPRPPKSKPVPRRKKKRPRKTEDLMEDVFSEVFSEDAPTQSNSNAARAPQLAMADEQRQSEGDQEVQADAPTVAEPEAPKSAMQMAMADAAEKSLPKTKLKKKRGVSGPALKLPSPKVLGIAAAGLGVVLIVAGFATGVISLPVSIVRPDSQGELTRIRNQYEQMAAGEISPEDWQAFGESAALVIRQIDDYTTAVGSPSEQDLTYHKAAIKLMELTNYSADNKEARDTAFGEFQALLGGG